MKTIILGSGIAGLGAWHADNSAEIYEAFDATSLTEGTEFKPKISFEDGIKMAIDCILKEKCN